MLFHLKVAACCLGLAVVNIYKGGQLHCCPLEACVCMAVHGPIPATPLYSRSVHALTPVPWSLIRSHGVDGRHPTIRREEEFDEDRFSGEYYSGEEFYEDDSMLSGDRYYSFWLPMSLCIQCAAAPSSEWKKYRKIFFLMCCQVSEQRHRVWDSQRLPSPRQLLWWWRAASLPRFPEVTEETAASCHTSRYHILLYAAAWVTCEEWRELWTKAAIKQLSLSSKGHATECTHASTFNTHCLIYPLTQLHIPWAFCSVACCQSLLHEVTHWSTPDSFR